MPFALFGIDNDALNLTVNLLVLFLAVVYLALIAWTFFDARRRLEDPVLIACSVGASLFPFIGTIVYTILRPPEFLDDRRERELEIRAAELRVKQLTEQSCPRCEYPLEKGFLRCPNCQARVKHPCPSCGEPIDPRWSMCPYCETPLRREPAKRRAAQPERRPRREPERRPARQPRREPARPAQPAASQQRASQKRAKRPAGQTQPRKASTPAARRATGQAGAEQGREQRAAERRAPSEGGEPPRPATAS
jgi:Double zinc ribbon